MTLHHAPPDPLTVQPAVPAPPIVLEDVAKRLVNRRTGRVTTALEHLSFSIREGAFV